MSTAHFHKLIKVRKTRADNAARELSRVTAERDGVAAALNAERQKLQQIIQVYQQAEQGFQDNRVNSISSFAAVQGDLIDIKIEIHSSQLQIADIEEQLALADRRIVEARARWREKESAHDRFNELTSEIKKAAMMAALASEEFMDN